MKTYRIYTERTGTMADNAEREISKSFEGYTRIDAVGVEIHDGRILRKLV